MQFPLNCTGKSRWAKIPYFGVASQFRTDRRRGRAAGFATFAPPGGDEIAHLQRLKITRQEAAEATLAWRASVSRKKIVWDVHYALYRARKNGL